MKTILVVDDEKFVRGIIRNILELENYKVEEAANGEEAIQKLEGTDFDLVISDLHMPIISGLDLLEIVKNRTKKIPLVLITGQGSEKVAVDCMKKGVDDYIVKPFKVAEIIQVVKTVLEL